MKKANTLCSLPDREGANVIHNLVGAESNKCVLFRILAMFLLLCAVNVAWADSYTIICKTGTLNSNNGETIDNTPKGSIFLDENDNSCLTCISDNNISATRVFYQGSGGMRMGSNKGAGTIRINLSASAQVTPTSVVVRAKKYGTDPNSNLTLNGTAVQITTTEFANYTYNITGTLEYLELVSAGKDKRLWIESITVNYTSAASHTLTTAVDPAGYGTVTPNSATVGEGSTATITATPNSGYAFDHWTVSGVGSSLSSTTTNPTTFTMGTANATVTAYFTALPAYRVTFNAGTGTCATPYLDEASGGAGVVLPSATAPSGCDPEYSFYGWSTSMVSETSTPPSIVGTTGDTYHPTGTTTLYAVYIAGGYEKITSNLTDWSGTYLIVYEAGSKAFDGSLDGEHIDAANNNISVTIANNTIVSNSTTDAASFEIAKTGEKYTIMSSAGEYVYALTNTNSLYSSPNMDNYPNSISYNAGGFVDIISDGGSYLRFNNEASQKRFRFFKSDTYTGQQAIQLYRKNGASSYNSNPSCSCPAPSAFAASSITYTSASLSWTPIGTESNWQIVLSQGTPLIDPATGTIHDVTSTSYNATSIAPGATYYAYVRAKCAVDDFSGWRMVQFETPCIDQIVSLNNASVTLAPTDTYNLAFVDNSSTGAITWTSSNESVATVASNGRVTAVAEGHCVITGVLAQESPYCGASLSCNIHVAGDDCARVGWGNKKDGGVYYQSTSYPYSYTQQIYSANEIIMAGGTAGKIGSIKVHHGDVNLRFTSTVYMGMTDMENLSADWVESGLTQVYSGTINFSAGWVEIDFDTPFDWDGESNIVVAFYNHLESGTDYYCISHDIGNTANYTNKKRYCYDGSLSLDLNHVPTGGTSISSTNRVNMKFCITPCTNPVDAYFSEDEKQISSSASFNVAALLTVNPSSGHGAVTYSSNNTSVATVNETTGVVTPLTEGSVVITAHVAASSDYCSANASITLNVCNCPTGDEQYEIGVATSSYAYGSPVYPTFKYGYKQIIYNKEELTPGTIHSIAFNYAYATAMSHKGNVDIYIGTTDKTEFTSKSDWISYSNLTKVYNGPLNCSRGWNVFAFNQNGGRYEYDGCRNLVIAIDDNSNDEESSSSYAFYCSESVKKVVIYHYSDSDNLNPASPVDASTAPSSTYPDVRFCISPAVTTTENRHTLTYDHTTTCSGTVTPTTTIPSVSAAYATVTSVIPSCSAYAGFKEWNTMADGSGIAYHAGDRITLSCNDVTLYAIYNNEVHGEASCANAVAFCSNSDEVSFHVEAGSGQTYGDFCAYFGTPATWWYMQIAVPGDISMRVHSSAGDVDMACWGPFDNKTCDLADLTDNGSDVWYAYDRVADADKHYSNSSITPTAMQSTPICSTYTLARPCGNLIDYGGTTSSDEYLQIIDAEVGEYYMVLVANYANTAGEITFTQIGGSGRASCDIVSNCDITSISANTVCTGANSYTVSGEISFRDAPVDVDARLTIRYSDAIYQTFEPPFASPIAYSFEGLVPNGSLCTLTASFTSSTINCEKTSTYTAPSKDYCEEVVLPITLLSLHGECNGKRAIIAWTTASERNNDYFVVERSDDAMNFVEVGRVAGAGNSITALSYSFTDYGIGAGDNYYRLTQVDYDGTRTTSEIIEVHCSGNVPLGDPDVYVYPNPFSSDLTVHLVNFGDKPARIAVYDMLGRQLFERTAYPTFNDSEIVLQLGALPDAAYTVRVSTADFVVNKKVVKNK
ncbi:MAG: Ig-like domain-containing protein [Bacteroidales bacterium]|nr:Ig-like domain-containing protein [Bacteroidales bacterium]